MKFLVKVSASCIFFLSLLSACGGQGSQETTTTLPVVPKQVNAQNMVDVFVSTNIADQRMSQIFNFLSRDIRSAVFWSETTTDVQVSDCLKGGKISRSFNGGKFVFTPQNCDTGELFIASGSLTKTPETAPPMLRRQYEMINLELRRSGSTSTLQRVNGIVDSSNAAPRVDVYEGSLSFSALGKTDYYKKIEHLTGFPNSVKSTFELTQFGFSLAYARDAAGMVEVSASDMSTIRWQSVRNSLPVRPDEEVNKLNFQLKLYANLLDAPIATKTMSVTEVYSEIEKQTK